jgi:hypothetical protein
MEYGVLEYSNALSKNDCFRASHFFYDIQKNKTAETVTVTRRAVTGLFVKNGANMGRLGCKHEVAPSRTALMVDIRRQQQQSKTKHHASSCHKIRILHLEAVFLLAQSVPKKVGSKVDISSCPSFNAVEKHCR